MRFAFPCGVVAFVLGIVAADLGLGPGARVCSVLALGSISGGVFVRGNLRAGAGLVAAALLGAAALSIELERAEGMGPDPVDAIVEGRVAERVFVPGRARLAVDRVRRVGGGPVPERLQLWIEPDSPLADVPPGAGFRAAVRVSAPRAPGNPGGRDGAHALARRGIGAVGGLQDQGLAVATGPDENGPRAWLAQVRRRSARELQRRGQGGALLATLALGDRGGLDPALREAAARGGVAHLLAVSGLHLALVAGFAFVGLRSILRARRLLGSGRWDGRRLAWAGAAGVGAAYALVTGAPVSMRRAFVFLLVLGAAGAWRRPVTRMQRLSLAAAAVLWLDPAAVFDPGAQLSFVATAALFVPTRRADEEGFRERIRSLLAASAAAAMATAPIAALHFGTASPFGWIANVLAIPFTGLVLLPLALGAAAIVASGLGAIGAFAGLVDLAAAVAAWALEATEAWASIMPPAGAARPGPLGWCLAAVVSACGLASRRLRWRLVAASMCGALLVWSPPAAIVPAPPRVVFLDVGWGDAVLVEGRSAAVLVDAGGRRPGTDLGRSVVLPALARLGVRRLDVLVASHGDRDHRGGLPSVLRGIEVGELWLPHGGADAPAFTQVVEAARERGVPIRTRGADSPRWRRGDLEVETLWPPARSTGSSNAQSLVLRVTAAGHRVLLTGDLEREGEHALLLLEGRSAVRADVLKLGHHGSRTSSHGAFLRAVSPRWTVVSAPTRSRLAFPHPSVLERIQALGLPLAWTGRDGCILIGLDDLEARGWRSGVLAD